jgi:hypothetical protein
LAIAQLEELREEKLAEGRTSFSDINLQSLVALTQGAVTHETAPMRLEGAVSTSSTILATSPATPTLREPVKEGKQGRGKGDKKKPKGSSGSAPLIVVPQSVAPSESAEFLANKELVTQMKAMRSDVHKLIAICTNLVTTHAADMNALATLIQRQEIEIKALVRAIEGAGTRREEIETIASSLSDVGPTTLDETSSSPTVTLDQRMALGSTSAVPVHNLAQTLGPSRAVVRATIANLDDFM